MPNILITGTPGTGKSSLASCIVKSLPDFVHIDVSKLAIEQEFYTEKDDLDSFIIDEDKLLDYMEDVLEIHSVRNKIVEYHGSEFFPERWFDLVVVLRTQTEVLYERLVERGYSDAKIEKNMDAEIFQVCLDEATENYKEDIVWELQNSTINDLEDNTEKIVEWIKHNNY